MDTSRIDNWKINQGQDFARAFPILTANGAVQDLTGASARAEWRPTAASSTVIHTWDSSGHGITFDLVNGLVIVTSLAAENLSFTTFSGVHQLLLTLGNGSVIEVARGKLTVNQAVTR